MVSQKEKPKETKKETKKVSEMATQKVKRLEIKSEQMTAR